MALCLGLVLALGSTQATAQGLGGLLAAPDSPAQAPADTPDGATDGAAGSGLAALLEVLRDDAARDRLIDELEAALAPDAAGAETVDEPPVEPVSLGRRLAETTQSLATTAADQLADIGRGLGRAQTTFARIDAGTWATIYDAALDLLLVLLVTVGVFLALRRLLIPLYRRMGRYAGGAGPVLGLGTGVVAVFIDALIVVVAWAVGFVVTTTVFGDFGQIGLRQTLYLNAFLAVEMVKVVSRAILSPSTRDLRVLPVSDVAALRASRVVNIVVSLLGYGQLLVVPIINTSAGYFTGRAVAAVIACLAVLYLVAAVLRYRRGVGAWLVEHLLPWRRMTEAERVAMGAPEVEVTEVDGVEIEAPRVPADGSLAALLKLWWLPVIGFLAYVLYEALTQPIEAVVGTILGTLRVAAAVVAGILVARVLAGLMARGVRLPEEVNRKVPLLEPRINRLVPRMLAGLRYVVMAAVAAYALETLGVLRVWSWLGGESGLHLTGTLLAVTVILVVSYAIWVAFSSWVEYRLNPEAGLPPSSRETTLLTLLKNAVTVAIVVFTLMFVLSELGLNIGPLIASAGVLGLAIGFGAQKMVQDIITGVFIQFENAINVGDVVTVGGTTGGVEKLTVRSVTLRDVQGIVHIVPFSSVDMVSNYTRDFSFYVLDMGVAYREDVDEARQALFDAYDQLRDDPDQGHFLIGDLEYFGLDAFGDSAVVLKCRIKTVPGKQWGVGRAYNRLVKRVFDERGIEIPYPHTTLFLGEAKDGSTQQIRLAPAERGGDEVGRGVHDPARGRPTDDGPLGDGDD